MEQSRLQQKPLSALEAFIAQMSDSFNDEGEITDDTIIELEVDEPIFIDVED